VLPLLRLRKGGDDGGRAEKGRRGIALEQSRLAIFAAGARSISLHDRSHLIYESTNHIRAMFTLGFMSAISYGGHSA
jgi:hypothetical protein